MRAPLWAAHCRVASDCPRPSLLCNAYAAAGCALSSSHPTVQAFCFLCGAYAAVGCALSSSHPTTQAFRFPCSACAAVGCALPCCIRLPKTFVALQCMIFFSIGLLVLIGLCFFYRLETSAPGLSGYYWYNPLYTLNNHNQGPFFHCSGFPPNSLRSFYGLKFFKALSFFEKNKREKTYWS